MGTGRQTQYQVTHKVDVTVNWNDPNIGSGEQVIGYIPKGAFVLRVTGAIITPFNAATTNTLSLGFSAGGTDLVNAQAAGAQAVFSGVMTELNSIADEASADQPIYATYNQTGAAATAGQARLVIEYSPNNG